MDKNTVKIKNLIVGGCSFTANGLGGSPPTKSSGGGNSYNHGALSPWSWAGHLSRMLDVESLVNVAAAGHGNILTANAMMTLINSFNYNTDDTLIVFNLTDPARLDIICDFDCADADPWISWTKDIIPYTFLNRDRNFMRISNVDKIERLTTATTELLFDFLEHKGFSYYFMTMNDVTQTPLNDLVEKHKARFIPLSPGKTMMNFCKLTDNTVSKSDFHPSENGHKMIAEQVYNSIFSAGNL